MFYYEIFYWICYHFYDFASKFESNSGTGAYITHSKLTVTVGLCKIRSKSTPQCSPNSSIELGVELESGYDWTEIEQGHVIGSYYYGYLAASLFINTFLNNFSPQVRL